MLFALSQAPSSAPPLKIVVLAGEDAVNVVQQKTAVRPLVEVRDRNNVPVSGASVTFTVGSGQPAAFSGGAQTITVTTNASGQAAATGFSATGPGAVQIQVQAAHQGQIAAATISQTNFATAAAAAAAGAAVGGAAAAGAGGSTAAAAGGAATGAAAGGGGISAVTIGIVGAAVAGGAVAVTQVAGGSDGGDDGTRRTYTGQFSGQMTVTTTIVNSGTCTSTRAVSGTVEIRISPDGQSGALNLVAPQIATAGDALSCFPNLNPTLGSTVPASNFSFTITNGPGPNETKTMQTGTFTGSQAGDVINGTLTYTEQWSGNSPGRPQNVVSGGGTISFQVALR